MGSAHPLWLASPKPQAEPPSIYNPIPGKDKPLSGPYGNPEPPPQAPAQGAQQPAR